MNKRIFFMTFVLMATLSLHAQNTEFETATQAVKNMKVGWNLGNTFDSHKIGVTDVTQTETMRGQAVTTPELMEMMKMAGFNAIRVPVTWYPHMDAAGNIDEAWMNRIEEVVNYVINQGMYCIINVHHDTGKTGNSDENKGWLRATRENYTQNKAIFEKIWQQIATRFKDYGQLLIFEGYNEILDLYDSFNYPTYKRSDGYDEEIAQSAYDAINSYAKSFVETVRATGGNNAYRNLIVSTYAAADARSEGEKNLGPVVNLNKPENSDHIIFEVHTYPPIIDKDEEGQTVLRPIEEIVSQIDYMISNMKTYFVERYNSPVIFGEWGTSNVDAGSGKTDYDLRHDHMFQFVDEFVKRTKANDMATFYWMGLSNGSNRGIPQFNQPDLAEQILKAYYGDDYEPSLLTENDYEKEYIVKFNGQWSEINLAVTDDNSDLATDYTGVEVILNEPPSYSGNLSFRVYYSLSNDNDRDNKNNITSINNTLLFNTISRSPIKRVTIVWRTASGTPTLKIKSVKLLKADGSKVSVTPTVRNNCTFTVHSSNIPNYIKAKISDLKYSTLYYGNKNLTVPPYVTATAYKVENGKLIAVQTYEKGDVIPSGTGVVLNGKEANTYKFSESDKNGTTAEGSMMRGSDVAETTTGGDKYYMLSLNRDSDPNSVGFYFGKTNGASFTNGAHKAYLAVPANEAKAVSYLFSEVDENGETTGVSNFEHGARNTEQYYSIDGRRLQGAPTSKGIYIVNGRKLIVK